MQNSTTVLVCMNFFKNVLPIHGVKCAQLNMDIFRTFILDLSNGDQYDTLFKTPQPSVLETSIEPF